MHYSLAADWNANRVLIAHAITEPYVAQDFNPWHSLQWSGP
jgi:hypothetical protein